MVVVVCASGYFDPLHVGHLDYLINSRNLGDELVVIVNNDEQASLKKGSSFMKVEDRARIVSSLSFVDRVVISVEKDRRDVSDTLRLIKPDIFCNGGDQFNDIIPEKSVCDELGIELTDGLGLKVESSRWLIKRANSNIFKSDWIGITKQHERIWGYYEHLIESMSGYQVKRLVVKPKQQTSLQVHQHRSETWIVVGGKGEATIGDEKAIPLYKDVSVYVPLQVVHQIRNTDEEEELVLIEVQVGCYLGEDDITRF